MHLTGYYADTIGNPGYIQYFSTMTPLNFIGLDYYKIRYTRLLMGGIEYRIEIYKDFYLSFEGDMETFIKNPFFFVESNKPITGFGIGLTYNSFIGRMVVKFGSKELTPYNPDKKELWSTFFIGFPL